MAWIGIRPLAMSWPPERRAADANGAAHRFSKMSTPAVLPGSMAAARWSTSSAASSSASSASMDCSSPSSSISDELGGVDRAVLVLVEDQDVDDADRSGVDEPEQLRRHLAGEVLRAGRKLDHHVVNRAELVKRCVRHVGMRHQSPPRRAARPESAHATRAGACTRQVSPRHLRSNGRRQARGAIRSSISGGPHEPWRVAPQRRRMLEQRR